MSNLKNYRLICVLFYFLLLLKQLYDQPRVYNKKTLMPRMQSSQSGEPHQMVEQSLLFDIYLCDNCEAELYSLEAYQVSVVPFRRH